MTGFIVTLVIATLVRIFWGWATQTVIENKGYYENWFLWGFIFGLIAFVIALVRPENVSGAYTSSLLESQEEYNNNLLTSGGWKCFCGKVNPSYTGTCSCGRTKDWYEERERRLKEEENEQHRLVEVNLKLETLKKLKELLDIGAITEEEYHEKKKMYL